MKTYSIEESPFSHFFLSNTKSSVLWLIVRLYIGWEWLSAGWAKINNPAWVGDGAGSAVKGFLEGALAKTSGPHPDVQWWYAYFVENFALEHTTAFSYTVAYGELLVGLALILGFLVGISAFFGIFMNFNYLLAGTVSVNPIMLALGISLILAWRVAGYLGLDYFVLPLLYRKLRPLRREGAPGSGM